MISGVVSLICTMLLLIDADSLIWKAALSSIKSFGSQTFNDVEGAIKSFRGRLEVILRLVENPEYILCYSSGKSFRVNIDPSYKDHRPPPPPIVPIVKQEVYSLFGGIQWPGLEADDIVGIHHNPFPLSASETTVVYSEDKDLQQLSGLYLSRTGGIMFRTPDEAYRSFYTQVLIGDPADGYSGCPGIGPKKAAMLLQDAPRHILWDIICHTFESRGLTEADAIKQAKLAWILKFHPSGCYGFEVPIRKSEKLDWSKLHNGPTK